MAAKKQAKPKAKPEPKPELELDVKYQHREAFPITPTIQPFGCIDTPAAVPMTLQYSASDLAAMARKAKAGQADMGDVIAEHDLYLSLVKLGAQAPAADVDFVKKHMAHLKAL